MKVASGSNPQSWKDIYANGRKMNENCALQFIGPHIDKKGRPFAKISKTEVAETVQRWNNTLIGNVMRDKPFYLHHKACVIDFGNQRGHRKFFQGRTSISS